MCVHGVTFISCIYVDEATLANRGPHNKFLTLQGTVLESQLSSVIKHAVLHLFTPASPPPKKKTLSGNHAHPNCGNWWSVWIIAPGRMTLPQFVRRRLVLEKDHLTERFFWGVGRLMVLNHGSWAQGYTSLHATWMEGWKYHRDVTSGSSFPCFQCHMLLSRELKILDFSITMKTWYIFVCVCSVEVCVHVRVVVYMWKPENELPFLCHISPIWD